MRGIRKLERVTLKLTARNAARKHDAGATLEPGDDISVHYRSRVGLSSMHGSSESFQTTYPRAFAGMRQSASTLMLSDLLPAEGSSHRWVIPAQTFI